MSVGLVADGEPVVGVVARADARRHLRARAAVAARTCNGEPIRVSERVPSEAICATGFPFRRNGPARPRTSRCSSGRCARFEDLRRAGAASLDLAWTAAGVFDGYFEQALGPWDVAAGALLVREAGGVVTDWAGDDRAWLRVGRHRRRPGPGPRADPRGHRREEGVTWVKFRRGVAEAQGNVERARQAEPTEPAMSQVTTPTEPGWLPDPSGRYEWRYWDGGWTNRVANSRPREQGRSQPGAPAPPGTPARPRPARRTRSLLPHLHR